MKTRLLKKIRRRFEPNFNNYTIRDLSKKKAKNKILYFNKHADMIDYMMSYFVLGLLVNLRRLRLSSFKINRNLNRFNQHAKIYTHVDSELRKKKQINSWYIKNYK